MRKIASRLKIDLLEKPVKSLLEAEQAVSVLTRGAVGGILVTCTSLFSRLRKIAEISTRNKIPLYGCAGDHVVKYDALFSYAPDLYRLGRRAALYVDKILNGVSPERLPIQSPDKFEFVVNLKTAEALGIHISPVVLQRADKVIR